MADKYEVYPPGYDPTQDLKPPRAASLRPFLTCGAIMLIFLCGGAFFVGNMLSQRESERIAAQQTIQAQTVSPTATQDEWSATGTAIFWLTYTPTDTQTPSETPTGSLDEWSGTGTAMYWITYTPTITNTPPQRIERTEEVRPPARQPTQRPAPPEIEYVVVTSPPRPAIIITREVEVIVPFLVTATPIPTATQTATASATPSQTATETATATPSATETETPTATATEIPSETPTETETPTATATEIPSETPTETPVP